MNSVPVLALVSLLGVGATPAPSPAAGATGTQGAPGTPAGTPAAPATAAAVAKKGNYLKLAAPPFTGVNLDEKVATFFSEHFAGALVRRGVLVMTPSEINALIGLERTKQLAGCSEDASSCLAELSNALGVDGLVAGTVAKFGGTIQVNIKIFSARDGSAMKVASVKVGNEEQLLDALSAQAKELAPQLLTLTGKERAPTAEVEPDRNYRPNVITANPVTAVLGYYGVEYARTLSPALVVYVEPMLTRVFGVSGTLRVRVENRSGVAIDTFDDNGFRVTVGARYYWPGPARGFFGALQAEIGSGTEVLHLQDGTLDVSNGGTQLGLGVMLGHTWMIYDVVPLTIAIGTAYGFLEYEHGLRPIGLLNAGYSF